jgi:hypothetical protein
MNTSANTNQIHDITTSTPRAKGIGFLRRGMAGVLLATAISATAVGLAATSYADDGTPAPNSNATVTVPPPAADWIRSIFGSLPLSVGCSGSWAGHVNCYWH